MIFLVDYDRAVGRLATMRSFHDSQRKEAAEARLALEIDLNQRGVEHEVVLLEAATEDALRQTHRRYFESVQELARAHNPSQN